MDTTKFAAASAPVYRSRSGDDAVLAATQKPPPSDEFAWYSAFTVAHEVPITVAAVAMFGDFAVLAVMVGNQDYAHIGYARYLLHTFVLGDLAAHGIRHPIDGREDMRSSYKRRSEGHATGARAYRRPQMSDNRRLRLSRHP